jgi:hypothetical protein
MEPEGSLSYSQVPATCPYPEPTPSSPTTPPTSWRSILILSSHLRLGLPNGCHLHHKLIGLYNRGEKCLQRGTDWDFKSSSLRFVFKGLIYYFNRMFINNIRLPMYL